MANTDERPKFIVGVDVGTTFGGVAWELEDCPDDIELIQRWPGGGNSDSTTTESSSPSELMHSLIVTSQKIPNLCSYEDGSILKICYVPKRPRGAVIRGQEGNQVDSRIARYSYGVSMTVAFDPAIHRVDHNLKWCEYEEKWKLHDRMEWYIHKVSNF
ncbi:hypothetical protein PENCOP_c004G08335 [Penicillium coprophilum]|uniref:Uncharacterized protein n=1 Tax=Penicillium coprophilum TaxID=36646 RepID=A0A1V6UVG5_9EURO|nr:hypothetical protein PENCOP_c004G08335 [Penicillium coprophilum]